MAEFDTVDMVGNQYWLETVGDLHTTANTQHWWYNKEMSYVANPQDLNPLSRMIFYTIKSMVEKSFGALEKGLPRL